jgi:predicted nuclease of predicted toxin-antitoxin system
VRFFLDHDVPRQIADVLQRPGHEIGILRDELPVTTADEQVLAHAISTDRILITCNRDDFLALSQAQSHPGIIILIRRRTSTAEQGYLLQLLRNAGEPGIAGNINFA